MTKTIVALYDHRSDAMSASQDLQSSGFDVSAIEILSHADLIGTGSGTGGTLGDSRPDPTDAALWDTDMATARTDLPTSVPTNMPADSATGAYSGTGRSAGGILARLTGWGVPHHDAQVYAEGVRRGGSLLKLRIDEDDVSRAMDVLERGNVVDVEERGTAYRTAGWTGFDETSDYYDERSANEERTRYAVGQTSADVRLTDAATAMRDVNAETTRTGTVEGEQQIPLVEEEVHIGKRTVERGGVRVRSYIVETPVEEQVRLRDETVTVERRPGGTADVPADAFRERTIEVTETDEEAVVGKTAHVRETVVVRKDVEERAETVRDTVRRTEVEIDDARGEKRTDRPTDRSDLKR